MAVPSSNSVLENIIAGIFTDDNQTKQQYLSIIGLLYQAGINIALGAGAFFVFVALRPKNARVYARRYKALAKDERRPPRIGTGIFAWAPILWRTDEQYLLDTVDVDSVLFLRFLKMGMWLMGIFAVVGMCVIVPVSYTNGNNDNVTGDLSKFWLLWITLYHIINLNVYWLYVVAAYLITAIFFYFLWREFRFFIAVRQSHFASPTYQRKLQSRTLMVTRVPADMQSDGALHAFMSMCSNGSSGQPTQASIARKLGELQELIDSHEKAVRRLERVLHKFLGGDYATKPRPMTKVNGVATDAIEHFSREIATLEQQIDMARQQTNTFNPTSVGFVSFATPQLAHDAMSTMKNTKPTAVALAPHPKDVIWSNAQMPRSRRVRRLWTARLISVAFCFVAFWPVAALTFIGDAVNIRIIFPGSTEFFNRHSTLTTIWQTTFSPLILTLYYIAIPHVFRAISRYQGIATHTGVERSVLKKMYVFYFLSNIIVFTLVGLVVRAVLRNKSVDAFWSTMAHDFIQSLNQKAMFWTAYVSLKGLSAMLELAQMISLVVIFIKRYTRDLTPRELRDLTRPPEFDYSPVYSLYLWVFTISMFYSLYSPIALPFAFIDFVLAYWVYKYAAMYVYTTKYDTAGTMWRCVMNRMIASVVIFQIYLVCCLKARIDEFTDHTQDWINGKHSVVYAVTPLPVITTAFGIWLVHFWVKPRVEYMAHSAESAGFDAYKDAAEDASASATLGDRFLHPIFSQPLTTPMVDKRVRHLLPKVYRGRTSVLIPSDKPEESKLNSSYYASGSASRTFTNASTVFGSDTLDLESVMDERDRRDFDGATTPVHGRGAGRIAALAPAYGHSESTQYAHALSRSYSVESNGSGKGGRGNMVEMDHLVIGQRQGGGINSMSQANLLGHAQPPMSSQSSDVSDQEMDDMMMMTSLSQTYRQQQPPSQSVTYADDVQGQHYYQQPGQYQPQAQYQQPGQYQPQQQAQYQPQQAQYAPQQQPYQQAQQQAQYQQQQPAQYQQTQQQPRQQGNNFPARNVPRWD
ncbi:hypothetical protein GGH94_005736 [Coemansia aciculifera]|uniref:DUF221-domain-containing protein n=1 Tax=Coemansia aciculifera TaxID=417176 RepID=A0A9W8ICZ4_9FUNG|nr:hypothetical protein GGH94_005736 [Coemansia aciculifera]KAJ2870276.1 hypothetical protein GGH93_005694 [Coemansia aciculifera]